MSTTMEKTEPRKVNPGVPRTYNQLRTLVNQPWSERKRLPIGRDGAEIIPRRMHLTGKKLKALRETWESAGSPESSPPNPHTSQSSLYRYLVQSLIELGVNKAHAFADMKAEMKRLMSLAETKQGEGDKATTAWERFVGKESHADDEEKALDVNGRIHQNAEVLQRLTGFTPYGIKLVQVGKEILGSKGMVIDILQKIVEGRPTKFYRLNTDSSEPINEWRRAKKSEKKAEKKTGKKSPKKKVKVTEAVPESSVPAPVEEKAVVES
jgi:hypothetical protein